MDHLNSIHIILDTPNDQKYITGFKILHKIGNYSQCILQSIESIVSTTITLTFQKSQIFIGTSIHREIHNNIHYTYFVTHQPKQPENNNGIYIYNPTEDNVYLLKLDELHNLECINIPFVIKFKTINNSIVPMGVINTTINYWGDICFEKSFTVHSRDNNIYQLLKEHTNKLKIVGYEREECRDEILNITYYKYTFKIYIYINYKIILNENIKINEEENKYQEIPIKVNAYDIINNINAQDNKIIIPKISSYQDKYTEVENIANSHLIIKYPKRKIHVRCHYQFMFLNTSHRIKVNNEIYNIENVEIHYTNQECTVDITAFQFYNHKYTMSKIQEDSISYLINDITIEAINTIETQKNQNDQYDSTEIRIKYNSSIVDVIDL